MSIIDPSYFTLYRTLPKIQQEIIIAECTGQLPALLVRDGQCEQKAALALSHRGTQDVPHPPTKKKKKKRKMVPVI